MTLAFVGTTPTLTKSVSASYRAAAVAWFQSLASA